jgi:ferredoxin
LRHLRRIRAAIALLFLALFALGMLDFGRLPAGLARAAGRLQLVPALLALPAAFAGLAVVGVALVTILVGRVYCSTICPLGTLQDLLIRLGDRLARRGRLRFRFAPARRRQKVQLALAVVAGALATAGALEALELLEPFSSFGRMASALARPLVAWAWSGLALSLSAAKVYAVAPVAAPPTHPGVLLVAALWLAGISALSLSRGRLFCNLLCPTGALLELFSRRPAVRIGIDADRCNGCGLCERACKAECIDAVGRRVEPAACVGCFDCLDVCKRGGVRLERGWRRAAPRAARAPLSPPPVDPGRRALLALAVPAVLLAPSALGAAADPRDARAPITPPGSGDRARFTGRCTACHLCVAACPTQVLSPSLLGYGLAGLLQPRLSYHHGACAPDCVRCAEVCPTGAIRELPVAVKHLTQIGRARFVKADCVVEVKRKVCGACAEHCPTKAISMKPYGAPGEGLRLPEVDEEACIGCGACEHPCPVEPRKAIWVEARPVHGTAKRIEQPPLTGAGDGEFPF